MPDAQPTPRFPLDEALSQNEGFRALARRLVGEGEADDLVQEAWLLLLGGGPAKPEKFRAWMFSVLRGRARDQRRSDARRAAREEQASSPEPLPTPPEVAERLETHRLLLDAIDTLPPPYRAVILERYFEFRSTAEIATREGVAESSVRARLSRAHTQLREDLDRRFGKGKTRLLALLALCGVAYPSGELAAGEAVVAAGAAKTAIPAAGGITLTVVILVLLTTGGWFEPKESSSSANIGSPPLHSPVAVEENSAPPPTPSRSETPSALADSGDGNRQRNETPRGANPTPDTDHIPEPTRGKKYRGQILFQIAVETPRDWRGTVSLTAAFPNGGVIDQERETSSPRDAIGDDRGDHHWRMYDLLVDHGKFERALRASRKRSNSRDTDDWILTVDLVGRESVRSGSTRIRWEDSPLHNLMQNVIVRTEDLRDRPTLVLAEPWFKERDDGRALYLRGDRTKIRLPGWTDPHRVPIPPHLESVRYSQPRLSAKKLKALPRGAPIRNPIPRAKLEPPEFPRPTRGPKARVPFQFAVELPPDSHWTATVMAYLQDGTPIGMGRDKVRGGRSFPQPTSDWTWVSVHVDIDGWRRADLDRQEWAFTVDLVRQGASQSSDTDWLRTGLVIGTPCIDVPFFEAIPWIVPTTPSTQLPHRAVRFDGERPRWTIVSSGPTGSWSIATAPATETPTRIPELAWPETTDVIFAASDRRDQTIPYPELATNPKVQLKPGAFVRWGRLLPEGTRAPSALIRLNHAGEYEYSYQLFGTHPGRADSLPVGPVKVSLDLRGEVLWEREFKLVAGGNDLTADIPALSEFADAIEIQISGDPFGGWATVIFEGGAPGS